jgi:hypothetical protein
VTVQIENREMVSLLTSEFQRRYEPQFSWANACSIIQLLPGLRGFWPMSVVGDTGNAQDQSGHAKVLTYTGNPVYSSDDLAPYIEFDGTGDYLTRADESHFDITAKEAFFSSQASSLGAARGLTLGGWFYPANITNSDSLMSKDDVAGNDRSYNLRVMGAVAGDPVRFLISDDGTNTDQANSASGYSATTWQFMAGRFNEADAGEELAVWLNDEKTTAATARASIWDSAAPFNISGYNDGSALFTGRASLCFLCAAALPDVIIWALYQQTRALFGV